MDAVEVKDLIYALEGPHPNRHSPDLPGTAESGSLLLSEAPHQKTHLPVGRSLGSPN